MSKIAQDRSGNPSRTYTVRKLVWFEATLFVNEPADVKPFHEYDAPDSSVEAERNRVLIVNCADAAVL